MGMMYGLVQSIWTSVEIAQNINHALTLSFSQPSTQRNMFIRTRLFKRGLFFGNGVEDRSATCWPIVVALTLI